MTEPEISLAAAQAKALIEAINARRDQDCEQVFADGRAASDRIIAAARAQARRRFHTAAETLRRDGARQIAQAEARRDTELRLRRQRARSALVAKAWPRLAEALAGRWRDRSARSRWIRAALEMASARLGRGSWQIEHPAAEGDEIRRALAQIGEPLVNIEWTLMPSDAITAGLRLRADGAVLDARPEALLALQSRVEAALIAEIERLATEGGGASKTMPEAAHG